MGELGGRGGELLGVEGGGGGVETRAVRSAARKRRGSWSCHARGNELHMGACIGLAVGLWGMMRAKGSQMGSGLKIAILAKGAN